MTSVTCGPGVKLHILASVLKAYHSMAVQVATATDTDELRPEDRCRLSVKFSEVLS